MITITIDTENEAFDRAPEQEVARILRVASERFYTVTAHDGTPLKDINGNTVGSISIKE